MALKSGRAIRFNEKTVRPMGRNASGVRGITLASAKDEVVGMICMDNNNFDILVVSENGYGKRSNLDDYRITNRGGKGVKTINVTDKTGQLISIDSVTDNDDLMIINRSGLIIRMAVADLRVMGRATQGVRLINLRDNDSIAAVTKVEADETSGDDEPSEHPVPPTESEFDTFPVEEDSDSEPDDKSKEIEDDEDGRDIVSED
jgi:DNA gyrase subunit A